MGRKLGIVLLIVLLILLVIPLGIGMAMAPCPECDTGVPMSAIAMCIGVLLASLTLLAAAFLSSHRIRLVQPLALLVVRDLDPPPRMA